MNKPLFGVAEIQSIRQIGSVFPHIPAHFFFSYTKSAEIESPVNKIVRLVAVFRLHGCGCHVKTHLPAMQCIKFQFLRLICRYLETFDCSRRRHRAIFFNACCRNPYLVGLKGAGYCRRRFGMEGYGGEPGQLTFYLPDLGSEFHLLQRFAPVKHCVRYSFHSVSYIHTLQAHTSRKQPLANGSHRVRNQLVCRRALNTF